MAQRRGNPKTERRNEKRELKRNPLGYVLPESTFYVRQPPKEAPKLRPKTLKQAEYLRAFDENTIIFGIGVAGTGKSYVAGAYAADKLKNGDIDKIIITRPGVEAGESFGFLPGEIEDKYAPYLEPFMSVLHERLGKSYVESLIKNKQIVAAPLSFMRGSTFKDAIVILDEAQNTSREQMKMFLTRIGENCKMIIDGDIDQTDIRGICGLQDAIDKLDGVTNIEVVEFGIGDIVRHGIIKDILRAYAK